MTGAAEDAKRCWHCGGPTEVVTAAGNGELRRCAVTDCFSHFRGPGVASFLVAEQKKLALRMDAERLTELRGEYGDLRSSGEQPGGAGNPEHMAHLAGLIAVYEECQARGRLFGGLR